MKKIKKHACIWLAAILCMVTLGNISGISYAATGDLGEGYNIDNLDAEYTTVDEQQISSHSDGIVTVLLFARTNGRCWNSTTAISSLCSSNWVNREGVRVMVVDIDSEPVETVKAAQSQNTQSNVIFCYDESFASQNMMWNYVDSMLGVDGSVTLPVLVIVDGNNKVQYCKTGYMTEKDIYPYVEELAGWGGEEADDGKVDVHVEGTCNEQEAFQVLERVNAARAKEGLPVLKMDAVLMEKAMQRAAECSVYYDHTRPDGGSCFTILDKQYRMGCAENIAVGYGNAEQVMEGWLNSPGHYANIMGEDFTNIGVGCFCHDGVLYWTQLFSVYGETEATQQENYEKKAVVKADPQYLGTLSLQYDRQELKVGETASPTLRMANLGFAYSSAAPSLDTVTFQTSDESVATVDQDGTLHAHSAGKVVITAVLDGVVKAEYSVEITGDIQPHSGDLNGDGNITLTDAYMALTGVMHAAELTEQQELAADVDGEEGMSLTDVQMILRMALKIAQQ